MPFVRTVTILVLAAALIVPGLSAAEETPPKVSPPAAAPKAPPPAPAPAAAGSKFTAFIGQWKGKGEWREAGKTPAPLTLTWRCRKATQGSSVACEFGARGEKLQLAASDLMGTDAASGQSRWFSLTGNGEASDYQVQWTDARNLKARYGWTQAGKKMEKSVTVTVTDENSLAFRSVVTADGKEASTISGKLERMAARAEKGERQRDHRKAREPAQPK